MRLRILLLVALGCLLLTDAAQAQRVRGGRWGGWDGGWGWGGPYYGYYAPGGYYYENAGGYYYGPGYYAPSTTYVQPTTGIIRTAATVNAPTGLEIREVLDGSAAKKANLHAGDIITAVGSSRTQTFEELQKALATANGAVELTYLNGATMNVDKVKLTPNDGKIGVAVVQTYYFAPAAAQMRPSTGVIQASATVNAPTGLQIKEVLDGSAAKKANLHAGDIITAVGSARTQTFEELQKAIAAANGEVEVTYLNGTTMKTDKTKLTPSGGKIGVMVVPTYLPQS